MLNYIGNRNLGCWGGGGGYSVLKQTDEGYVFYVWCVCGEGGGGGETRTDMLQYTQCGKSLIYMLLS